MIERVTDWAEVLGLLCMALGFAWLVAEKLGVGWGLVAFGTAILLMSALLSAVRSGPRKDDPA